MLHYSTSNPKAFMAQCLAYVTAIQLASTSGRRKGKLHHPVYVFSAVPEDVDVAAIAFPRNAVKHERLAATMEMAFMTLSLLLEIHQFPLCWAFCLPGCGSPSALPGQSCWYSSPHQHSPPPSVNGMGV